MPPTDSQTFLRELDKKLWTAADKLRSNLDAAVYKQAMLGLIFLKYVSDSFAQRRAEIERMLKDPDSDFFLDPASYDSTAKYEAAIHAELEEHDYYIEKNVFWVPSLARWRTLQDSAKLPPSTEIQTDRGPSARSYKITSTGKLIDDALEAIEKENVNRAERYRLSRRAARRVRAGARIKLNGVLDRRYTQLQIDPVNRADRVRLPERAARRRRAAARINLSSLIDLIAGIPFQHADLHAKDIRGHVYENFLGQFALAEGKKCGQYFTPKSIVSLIVEMIEPYQGRVSDPSMGSGGLANCSEIALIYSVEINNLPDKKARRAISEFF